MAASSADLRAAIDSLMARVKTELAELVSYRSVADPRQYPPEECAKAARWVADAFTAAGFADVSLNKTADGSQAIVGHRNGQKDAKTVLLYAHYDVQPPLDEKAWRTPPFELTERDGRWYGRGTADCKGNILMHLTALRALQAVGAKPPVNLTLVVEGSEEQGTGGLEDFVPKHADQLQRALIDHLNSVAPWHVRVEVEPESDGQPFLATTGGPAYRALDAAMREAYGKPLSTAGQGGSIPLCNIFQDTYPDAEVILMGVEEPLTLMHAPNESVDPTEIANMALAEALFLQNYGGS
jgi:acetylornithine deacetylase/succinyl-diaminopimelate desuccinylase-like protein